MKYLLIAVASFCMIARAQPTTTPSAPRDPAKILERAKEIASGLKLSDEQKTKIDEVFTKANADVKEMKAELETLEPQQRMKQVGDFFKGVREQVEAVLNDEQKKQFAEKVEAERAKMRGPGAPGGPIAERIRQALEKLDLTEEQKEKLKTLRDEFQEKFAKLRESGESAKMREAYEAALTKVNEILTPQQREKLDKMRERLAGPLRERFGPATKSTTQKASGDPEMMDMTGEKKAANEKLAPVPEEKVRAGPAIGEAAPPFELKKLDGTVATLSAYKGHVVVLEFGSYSCPSFRSRAAGMEQLKRDLGSRATFLVIYTKEAHPAGKWDVDRNKDDGVSVEQPADDATRKALAKTAQEKLKITMPIALDKMDNSVSVAYGLAPNGAVIIGRDGKIAACQKWTEPFALRTALEGALAVKPSTRPASG